MSASQQRHQRGAAKIYRLQGHIRNGPRARIVGGGFSQHIHLNSSKPYLTKVMNSDDLFLGDLYIYTNHVQLDYEPWLLDMTLYLEDHSMLDIYIYVVIGKGA